jgi:predicted outer membrane repeat protein
VRSLALCLLIPVALAAPCVCYGNTYIVPWNYPTIAGGLAAASYGDTVMVMCDTYFERDLDIPDGVVLQSETGQPDCVTINGMYLGRVLRSYYSDSSTALIGFTITGGDPGGLYVGDSSMKVENCVFNDNYSQYGGGGMTCFEASPDIRNCVFSNNSTDFDGAGLYIEEYSHPTVTDCDFMANIAGRSGGGVAVWWVSVADLTGCTFTGNSVVENGGGVMCESGSITDCTFTSNWALAGGGIHSTGTLHVTDCVLTGNRASASVGGGARTVGGFYANCVFESNEADTNGGGVWCTSSEYGGTSFIDCIFLGNSASRGGAIYDDDGYSLSMTGCTFGENTALTHGGAIYAKSEDYLSIRRSTFADNGAPTAGGIYIYFGGTQSIDQTIIAFSTQGGAAICMGPIQPVVECTDVYGNVGGDWENCLLPSSPPSFDNLNVDPLFCREEYYPAPYTLHGDSECLETNNPACGRIGAWGEYCPNTGIAPEITSWSTIKGLYR